MQPHDKYLLIPLKDVLLKIIFPRMRNPDYIILN
jgi:hypothetical protein